MTVMDMKVFGTTTRCIPPESPERNHRSPVSPQRSACNAWEPGSRTYKYKAPQLNTWALLFSDPEMPHILDLPTELFIKIFTDLDVWELGSCLLTCRRFKAIIQDTCLLQYFIHTALAGVHDPLFRSGPPLTHRLESLKRWSDAWRQPGAYLRRPASRVLTPTTSKSNTNFILCDDYLIALDFGGRQWHRHASGYEWLDLRNPGDGWAKIQFEENLIPLAVTLDADQEDLLAILFG